VRTYEAVAVAVQSLDETIRAVPFKQKDIWNIAKFRWGGVGGLYDEDRLLMARKRPFEGSDGGGNVLALFPTSDRIEKERFAECTK
jgi:hypothetical protein